MLEIYQAREQAGWKRYLETPSLRTMVEQSGVENLAQLYTRLKYTRASQQDYSRTVLSCLARQDFFNQAVS